MSINYPYRDPRPVDARIDVDELLLEGLRRVIRSLSTRNISLELSPNSRCVYVVANDSEAFWSCDYIRDLLTGMLAMHRARTGDYS
jgi:hypothetical protein